MKQILKWTTIEHFWYIYFRKRSISPRLVMMKHSLPNRLRPLFWDYDFNALTWEEDRDLVIKRILTSGDWNAINWLRSHIGDASLKEWIQQHQGDGLSPRQLRFWELVLEIPRRQVNAWLSMERQNTWEKRIIPKSSTQRS